MGDLRDTQLLLHRQWRNVEQKAIANKATRSLLATRGDWDPPEGVQSKLPLIRMAIGIPDGNTLPKKDFARSAQQVIQKPGEAAFIYGFGMGYKGLRVQLAERYCRIRQVQVNEDWFQLTNGSAGAIDLICRTLIDPGDVIITESPTYMGTLRNFRGVLAEIAPVDMDADGLIIHKLERRIHELEKAGKRIKLIYTIANFQNPTGASLSDDRRLALLDIAAKHKILILDDDAYGELYFADRPPVSLSALSGGYGVITVGTFSKVLATGLRIGWIHAEPGLLELMGRMRFAMGLNQIVVRMISDYLQDGKLDDHVERVRKLYKAKLDIICNALDELNTDFVGYSRPLGGFYLWLTLKPGLSAEAVWRTATEEGVAVTPGVNFFPTRDGDSGQHLRVAFPWTRKADLEEGIKRLMKACLRVADGDVA